MKFDPTKLGFDPNLKDAAEEIKKIMQKYDIGGHITLVSPTHSEFMYAITPSWSCARFERLPNGEVGIRFTATEKRYGCKETSRKYQENTAHLLLQIRDLGVQAFQTMENVHEQLKKHIDIEHKPFSTDKPS